MDDSNAYIINCTITNNVGYHGGIHCQDSRSPMIKNSIIANNDGNQGGGISIYNYTEAIITNCKIINNTADWGAGFYFSHAAPSIIGCSIVGNAAERNGGGIQSDYDSEPKIINSTILNNTAVEYGGGISGRGFTHSGQFDIINTMVNYNTNGGIYFGYDRYNKNSVINSNIYDNKTYDYDGYVPENFGVISSTNNNGTLCDAFQNIFDDPMLSDTLTGDFSLQANSPCIDAGLPDTTGLELPQFDLNGNDRITDGNSDGNLYIDIGALEFSETIINNPPKIEKITNFEFINTENYNINLDTCVTDEEDLPENIHWNIVSHDNNLRITTANHLVIFTAPNWAGKTNVTFIASDNSGGSDTITVECTVNPPTSIDLDLNSNPKEFFLYQNYPNPFNPITSINYQLAKTSNVNLSIYNILGKKVVTLVTAKQQVGLYKIEWDASNFASGVYYYILKTDKGFTQSRKLILLR